MLGGKIAKLGYILFFVISHSLLAEAQPLTLSEAEEITLSNAPELERLLVQACTWLALTSWSSVEMLLLGCLYMPSVQGRLWQSIWARSEHGASRGRIGYPMVMR